jgi:hypothetical protein
LILNKSPVIALPGASRPTTAGEPGSGVGSDEAYERRSVLISSNLVFSKWDQIFKDPMTTMAAIDRLVHHATILEFTNGSVRAPQTKERQADPPRQQSPLVPLRLWSLAAPQTPFLRRWPLNNCR